MLFVSQGQDLRGDRGGADKKNKKKPKADKPAKGQPSRVLNTPAAPSRPTGAGQPRPSDTSSDDK